MAMVRLALQIIACVAAAAAAPPVAFSPGDTASLVQPTEWYEAWEDIQYWISLGQSLAGV